MIQFITLISIFSSSVAPPVKLREVRVDDEANRILRSAIQFQGGEEMFSKRRNFRIEVSQVCHFGQYRYNNSSTITASAPTYARVVVNHVDEGENAVTVIVFTESKIWEKLNDNDTIESDTSESSGFGHCYFIWLPAILNSKNYTAKVLSRRMIREQTCFGVRVVNQKNGKIVDLYFDHQTHQLLKMEDTVVISGMGMKREVFFSDYRKVQGILLPFRRENVGAKLNRHAIEQVKKITFLPKIDPATFKKP